MNPKTGTVDPAMEKWRRGRELARAIQAERARRGHTLAKAAAFMGITLTTLSSYLQNGKGTCHLAASCWPDVAEYLGWSVREVRRAAKTDAGTLARLTVARRVDRLKLARVGEGDYPLLTTAGWVLGPPRPKPRRGMPACEHCEVMEACREGERFGRCFVLCERPLESELIVVEEA